MILPKNIELEKSVLSYIITYEDKEKLAEIKEEYIFDIINKDILKEVDCELEVKEQLKLSYLKIMEK